MSAKNEKSALAQGMSLSWGEGRGGEGRGGEVYMDIHYHVITCYMYSCTATCTRRVRKFKPSWLEWEGKSPGNSTSCD